MHEIIKYQLSIKANDKLGILERILRVIRHRGGHVENMQMQITTNQILSLTIEITTERSISTLQNQLTKLFDVISVEV